MAQAVVPRALRIYGVPMDLGQNRRGVDMGPSAIRYAGLQKRLQNLGVQVYDGGNINVPVVEEMEEVYHGEPLEGTVHHMPAVAEVCRTAHEFMLRCIAADELALFLGGDHSISIGTISAALTRADNVGVIWVDAHGDFNTPATSPSGNIHGMVVSCLMGKGPTSLTLGEKLLRPEQIVYVGTRDLDPEERDSLRDSGIKVLTMREIDERGMAFIARECLHTLGDVEAIHVSLDLDALTPDIAPGVGTPSPGGLSYREAHLLMEILADDGRVASLDLVEVNPILDDRNRTATVAVEMAASLFGKRII